jgi:UDP-2,3-diacylglucosamine pyrophosphatase LpxH
MRGFLESKLQEDYDIAVVGHVHRQMVWESEGGTAVVVGDWMKNRSVIELTSDGLRPMAWLDGSLVEKRSAGNDLGGRPTA